MYRFFFKRFFDIVLSLIALPFFFFLFLFVFVLIKIEDRGPIFYCGKRLGKKGKIFTMYKFRSMKVKAPDIRLEDGSTFNSENDDRVTKVGKFLRKTSIDEVPQIINILLGQMSLIGPRPDLPEHIEHYSEEEKIKLKTLPGITGYNQVYARNSIKWKERLQNDIYYVKKLSFYLDLKIFFKTIITIVMKKNIYVDDNGK